MKNGKNRRDFSIGGKLTVNRLGYGTKQIAGRGLPKELADRLKDADEFQDGSKTQFLCRAFV